MFERRRVIDRLHAKKPHHAFNPAPDLHRSQNGADLDVQFIDALYRLQFLLDRVQRQFRQFKKHQMAWRLAQNLATQLTANRPPCPGHHHDFVFDIGRQKIGFRRNGIAPKQIFDTNFVQFINPRFARHDVVQPRNGAQMHRVFLKRFQDFASAHICGRWHGQQHCPHAIRLDQRFDLIWRIHPQTTHQRALRFFIVIKKRDGLIFRALPQHLQKLPAGSPDTVNHNGLLAPVKTVCDPLPKPKTRTTNGEKHQNRIDNRYGARHRKICKLHHQRKRQPRQRRS